MRILKQLLIGFLGLCALMFLFSLLLPTKVRISRGIVISKPVDSIADYLEHIRQWRDWNPLMQLDAANSFTYHGDSIAEWISTQANATKNIVSIHLRRDSIIPVSLELYGQGKLESGFTLATHDGMGGSGTQVEWWIIEKTGWLPWNKFYGIFADKLKGPVLEKGLDQLKTSVEK